MSLVRQLEIFNVLREDNLQSLITSLPDLDERPRIPEIMPSIDTLRYYFHQLLRGVRFAEESAPGKIPEKFVIKPGAAITVQKQKLVISAGGILSWEDFIRRPIDIHEGSVVNGVYIRDERPMRSGWYTLNQPNSRISLKDIPPLTTALTCYTFAGGEDPAQFLKEAIMLLGCRGAYYDGSNGQWNFVSGETSYKNIDKLV